MVQQQDAYIHGWKQLYLEALLEWEELQMNFEITEIKSSLLRFLCLSH